MSYSLTQILNLNLWEVLKILPVGCILSQLCQWGGHLRAGTDPGRMGLSKHLGQDPGIIVTGYSEELET